MKTTDPSPSTLSASATPPGAGMDRRVERPRRKGRRLVLAGAGVALALVAVFAAVRLVPPPGSLSVQASDLQIAPVTRAPFHDYLPVRAEVAPLHTDYVTAVVGGQVVSVAVQDGVQVSAGQLLATLSNPQLKLDVVSKEAEIAGQLGSAQGQALTLESNGLDRAKQVAETDHDLLKAQHDLDVRRQLQAQGFVSGAEVKTYQTEADYYKNRLAALKAGGVSEAATASAQAALIRQTTARLNGNLSAEAASLDALNLRAPVAGRLTDFTLEPGQTLKPGDAVGQVDSEGAYKLTADVDEFYVGRVAVGQPATADIDGTSVPLTVSKVLPQVTDGHFRAELTFDHPPPAGLRRGQGLDVRIVLGATQDALTLPNAGWLEGGGGTSVFVVEPNGGRADRRAVTVGRRNPEQVEITSGLHSGERAVVSAYTGYDKFDHLILKGPKS